MGKIVKMFFSDAEERNAYIEEHLHLVKEVVAEMAGKEEILRILQSRRLKRK